MKTGSVLDEKRIELFQRMRFNPLREMSPEKLTRQIEAWKVGYLREFALTSDALEERDDVLKCVIPKRKKSAARNGYEILTVDDSAEAEQHKEVLEFLYDHLMARDAFDLNERGGVQLLLRQMMDAVGKKYAVHELVWQPSGNRREITLETRFVPLWFFENTLSRLRFLESEGAVHGRDLEKDGWMVTVGEGLMVASAIGWLFKNMALKDWVIYCGRHGLPGIKGVTGAQKDTPEWKAFVQAVEQFANEWTIVTNDSETIELLETKGGTGAIPFPDLVERFDRALIRLWRGADLGTMSQGKEGVGASLQGEESDLVEEDDAEMLSETLNQQIDRPAIAWAFGEGVRPLAYIKILTSNKQDVEMDLKIDGFLLQHRVPMAVEDLLERFGRPMPDGKAALVQGPEEKKGLENWSYLGNGSDAATLVLMENALPLLAERQEEVLQPLRHRVAQVLRLENEVLQRNALRALQADLPLLLRRMNDNPGTAELLKDVFGAAFLNGMAARAALREGGGK